MIRQRLQRVNFVDEAYGAIKRLILSGQLRPGTQLKIDGLSQRLGVSNSPIREALRRLEHERWVETIPYRGSFVRPFDEHELKELYEVREMLELAALRKAMPIVSADGITRLERASGEIQTALRKKDQAGYLTADTTFHQALVDLAGNGRLSELFGTLAEQGKCFSLGRGSEAMGRYKAGQDEHVQLLKLIRQGKTREAIALLKRHLRVSMQEIESFRAGGNGGVQ